MLCDSLRLIGLSVDGGFRLLKPQISKITLTPGPALLADKAATFERGDVV